jgi:nucleoside phosphorylase
VSSEEEQTAADVDASPTASVLVMTALRTEMEAVTAHVSNSQPQMFGPVLCEVGEFEASNGLRWSVAAAEIGPGAVDTAAAVVATAIKFKPDLLMFVGIAGALKDDVAIGDVVVASSVCWTERAKASTVGLLARAQAVNLSYTLSQWARRVAREGKWVNRITGSQSKARTAVVGQIASGEKVIADVEYRREIKLKFSDAIAIETEGYGLARAAEFCTDAEVSVIRGISDAADSGKNDSDQGLAADVAAAFAFELLDAYSAVIVSTAIKSTMATKIATKAAVTADPSGELGSLGREIIADIDMLEDDRAQVEALARQIAEQYEVADLSALLSQLALALQGGVSPIIERRIIWFGHQLLRSAGPSLSEWPLEEIIKSAPQGMASLLVEPSAWAWCSDGVRRRCLTALLGPADQPRAPVRAAIELIAPLLKAGVVNEKEADRITSSFSLTSLDFLFESGISLPLLAPRLIDDLDSGGFDRQNVAARFLYRLPEKDVSEALGSFQDVTLGAKLVEAATGSFHSFGAAEAMNLTFISIWPSLRIAGGIFGALTYFDGSIRTEPSAHLSKLVAAAAGNDELGEVLNEVRKLLASSVSSVRPSEIRELADALRHLAASFRGNDSEGLVTFADWIESELPLELANK